MYRGITVGGKQREAGRERMAVEFNVFPKHITSRSFMI